MSATERLDNLYKLLLGASLAFIACHYLWEVHEAAGAGVFAGLASATFLFWSRRKKSSENAN